MPLDTGGISELNLAAGNGGGGSHADRPPPTLQSGADIGQALKAVREHQGLSLEELAEVTRVRASYLAAIEDLRLELLPSRPFTIGYIRAYATALGVDPDAAADRFRADEPVLDEPLREPLGVQDTRDPRFTSLVAGACMIIAAIFLWNIGRRAMTEDAPPPPTASDLAAARALAGAKPGPIVLGAPLPAPVESTTPPAYETPGLSDAALTDDGRISLQGKPKALDQVTDPPPTAQLAPSFTPKGAIFGAPANERSLVTVQALKSASLMVRGVDGSLYFARQLAPGEAFRAPQVDGLTFNVTDPNAFQVFVAGQSKGVLPAAQASVSGLAGG
ncbi:MAG: putative transcriptional regulator [Phenylobacterium sp.]|nr:putative transcriptional regulator [Phenylobacterium sp.]